MSYNKIIYKLLLIIIIILFAWKYISTKLYYRYNIKLLKFINLFQNVLKSNKPATTSLFHERYALNDFKTWKKLRNEIYFHTETFWLKK